MSRREAEQQSVSPSLHISQAMDRLQKEGLDIVTVTGWSRKMNYEDPTRFSDEFRREFGRRPQPVLLAFRVRKAIQLLREENLTNYEIARKLKLRNEKGLYQFIKHHAGHAPSNIATLPKQEYEELLERLEKNIIE